MKIFRNKKENPFPSEDKTDPIDPDPEFPIGTIRVIPCSDYRWRFQIKRREYFFDNYIIGWGMFDGVPSSAVGYETSEQAISEYKKWDEFARQKPVLVNL